MSLLARFKSGAREYVFGSIRLMNCELNQSLKKLALNLILAVGVTCATLFVVGWIHLSLAFWLSSIWGWRTTSLTMILVSVFTGSLFLLVITHKKNQTTDLNNLIATPEKQLALRQISRGKLTLSQSQSELNQLTESLTNPIIGLENLIKNKPIAFFMGGTMLGILLSTVNKQHTQRNINYE
jgi:hypothetical protein